MTSVFSRDERRRLNGNLCCLRTQIFDYVFVAHSYGDQSIVMELYRNVVTGLEQFCAEFHSNFTGHSSNGRRRDFAAEKLCVILETGVMSNKLSQHLGDIYQILAIFRTFENPSPKLKTYSNKQKMFHLILIRPSPVSSAIESQCRLYRKQAVRNERVPCPFSQRED